MISWTVLIPYKGSALGKSRLTSSALSDTARRALAQAFLFDVIDAAVETPQVARVIVTSPDAHTHDPLKGMPCDVLTEPQHISGLNASVQWALREVGAPHEPCAVLLSDLPFLDAHELAGALTLASDHERSMVTDSEGTGTTLLLANRTPEFEPAFGVNSRFAHERLGFTLLNVPPSSGLRHDVDTSAQLENSGGLTPKTHTSAALRALNLPPQGASRQRAS